MTNAVRATKDGEMAYAPQSSYSREDLIACGNGELFGKGNALLPAPPMLMFDRVITIDDTGGAYGKGQVIAEFDINPDLWFFECHFKGDPVMPGCLGLDALWQLTGFWMGWTGAPGSGRAIGVGDVKLTEQILPTNKKVTYTVDIKKFVNRRLILGMADGRVEVDGVLTTEVTDMKVGLFDNDAVK